MDSLPNMPLRACAIEDTVKADIVCTLTPAHAAGNTKEMAGARHTH